MQKKEEEECSFKPVTYTKNSVWDKRTKSNYSKDNLDNVISSYQESKEQKLLQMKQELEYSELHQCTFKPKTKKLNENFKKDVEVKGMQNYLEHIQKIRQKEIDKENRLKEVFGVAQGGSLKSYVTTDERGNN